MNRIFLLLPIVLATIGSGCETTGDPNEGGLFGWSQAKADQRLAERSATLKSEERQLTADYATSRSLQEQHGKLRRRIKELSADLDGLERDVDKVDRASGGELERRAADVRAEIKRAKAAYADQRDQFATAADEEEVNRLKEQVKTLQGELSRREQRQ